MIGKFRILVACFVMCGVASAQDHSALWGTTGEKWTPQSRLPYFSFSGYHFGEKPIPTVREQSDVTQFGARGDGTTDCTDAFRKAIEETTDGAITIPPGRYVITGIINIRKSNVVLRGAGPGKTVLLIPKSLQQIAPKKMGTGKSSGKRPYSFSGAFIDIRGNDKSTPLAKVAVPAKRGETVLTLSATPKVKRGQLVRLLMKNHADLGKYLHAGGGAGRATAKEAKHYVDWVARVVSVAGRKVTLDRPLRVDVRLAWSPELHTFEPGLSEVGIEDLTFEFPGVKKKPHLKEEGFSAIQFRGATHSWVRNVVVIDCDNAINVIGSRFCQFENIVIKAARRQGTTGHHALWVRFTQECLFTDFRVETPFHHDLTVEGLAHGNVFRNGSGQKINLDHHRNAPYENLFSNINVGNPGRLWHSTGRPDRGPHSGVRETFWNIHWKSGNPPKVANWPLINYVGKTSSKGRQEQTGSWIEALGGPVTPQDLYEAQFQKRMKSMTTDDGLRASK